ncbi:MAG: ATP synthase subunit I [Oscillospiraceae bacterium]|nr:ATP synthase subunit I [Oscillospiraceae bacterium]
MKKNQPIYEEMRSLSPYYLTMSGVYLTIAAVLCFAFGGDYSLPIGAMYGIILSALNFFLMGKSAQAALQKSSSKSAQTYMNVMYCVRYLGLFGLLTVAALVPFINLIAAAIPLFFVRIAITIREIKNGRSGRSEKREE